MTRGRASETSINFKFDKRPPPISGREVQRRMHPIEHTPLMSHERRAHAAAPDAASDAAAAATVRPTLIHPLASDAFAAAAKGDAAVVHAFLGARGSVDEREEHTRRTMLMLASGYGREQLVADLLAAGASPDLKSVGGTTALMCAAASGHLGTVAALRVICLITDTRSS